MLGNTLIFHASNPFRILDFNYVIATCQYCNLQDIAKAVYKKSSKLGFDCLEQSTKQLLHLLIHPQTTFKTKLDRCALNLYFFKDVVVLCSHLSSFQYIYSLGHLDFFFIYPMVRWHQAWGRGVLKWHIIIFDKCVALRKQHHLSNCQHLVITMEYSIRPFSLSLKQLIIFAFLSGQVLV